jgi:hypothetical protein
MGWNYPRKYKAERERWKKLQARDKRRPGVRPLWDDLIDSMKTLGPSTPRELGEDVGVTDLGLVRRTLRRMVGKGVAFIYADRVNAGHGGRRSKRYAVRGKPRKVDE